jgi:hypothetical protein
MLTALKQKHEIKRSRKLHGYMDDSADEDY